ncbi:MAG: hypothetical protein C4530_10680 [Desulfobacteraceae bacterium]|nr:MAG: hypothetical protein C4530_10680 [Desulfobacteraceae bacterium]
MVHAAAKRDVMSISARKYLTAGCLIVLLSAVRPSAAGQRDYFLPQPDTEKHVVMLTGTAAEEKHAKRFREWSLRLHDVLTGSYGYRPERITLLLGAGDPAESRVSGACKKETIVEAIDRLAGAAKPGDQILFILIGHGTSNEDGAKFNIEGPDITGEAFGKLLEVFSRQDIVVVNTTSASYPFCAALSAPGRVILSATRSRAEKYDTFFAQYLIEAFENRRADRDKNMRVSMWEAFQYARMRLEKWYTDNNRIPSEHSTLDDNGDALLSPEPDPTKNDGSLAQIAYLDVTPKSASPSGPEAPAAIELIHRVHALERAVFLLRSRKSGIAAGEYKKEMETLLIDLAKTSRDLRKTRN